MNYSISDSKLFGLVDRYMKEIFGELVLQQQTKHSVNIWGEGRYGPPKTEDNLFFPPFELNSSGILWNNLGSKSPHLVLEDIFGISSDELLMFYLEKRFNLSIKNVVHEEDLDDEY